LLKKADDLACMNREQPVTEPGDMEFKLSPRGSKAQGVDHPQISYSEEVVPHEAAPLDALQSSGGSFKPSVVQYVLFFIGLILSIVSFDWFYLEDEGFLASHLSSGIISDEEFMAKDESLSQVSDSDATNIEDSEESQVVTKDTAKSSSSEALPQAPPQMPTPPMVPLGVAVFPYKNLPSKPGEKLISSIDVLADSQLRAGLVSGIPWRRYQALLQIASGFYSKDLEPLLLQTLRDPKLWIRLRALIILSDAGTVFTADQVKVVLGAYDLSQLLRYVKRLERNPSVGTVYVFKKILQIPDIKAIVRKKSLEIINSSKDQDRGLFLMTAAEKDPSPLIRDFAGRLLTHLSKAEREKSQQALKTTQMSSALPEISTIVIPSSAQFLPAAILDSMKVFDITWD
jgi:hypothetical protein